MAKRCYMIAKEEVGQQGTQSYLTKSHNDIMAILPHGSNCFKLQGAGNRYVHGASSLQEMVVPVISFKNGKNIKSSKVATKVGISVTSIITHLTFFQNKPVDDKHKPLRVTVYFEDEDGNRISNENVIIADSTSLEQRDREYKEKFTLKNQAYDKGKKYYLVMMDDEGTVSKEIERIPYIIDLMYDGGLQF